MELKYKENSQWKVSGSLCLLVALLNLGLMSFMITGNTRMFGYMISPLYLIIILTNSVLAVFYFKITTIDYLRLNVSAISIHRGLVLPRKKINILEVEQGRVIGSKFILILKNQREIEINLKRITIKDFEQMKNELEKYFEIR